MKINRIMKFAAEGLIFSAIIWGLAFFGLWQTLGPL